MFSVLVNVKYLTDNFSVYHANETVNVGKDFDVYIHQCDSF